MVAKGSVGIGQGSLLAIEPIPERPPVDYGEDPQVSASKFIRDMSDKFNLSTSYTTLDAIAVASPDNIRSGLYVPRDKHDSQMQNAFLGVIFTDIEYVAFAKSPGQLAKHEMSKERKSRQLDPNKDRVEELAQERASGVLNRLLESQGNLQTALAEQRVALLALHNALKAPDRRRYHV